MLEELAAAEEGTIAHVREEGGELSMNANTNPSPKGITPSQQIDAIIKEASDWRGKKLSHLRALIQKADPAVVEEVK